MTTKKEKQVKLVSPAGTAIYPHLVTPDTKFNADGEYTVRLSLNPEDTGVSKYIERLNDLAGESFRKAKEALKEKGGKSVAKAKKLKLHVPFESEYDDNGDETGNIIVKFKSSASGTTQAGKPWKYKPPIFDTAGKQIKSNKLAIYSGSVLAVEGIVNEFSMPATDTAGINLRIGAVQIISLVDSSAGGTAESHGFSTVEDGYVYDEEDEEDIDEEEQGEDDEDDETEDDF